MEIYVTPAKEDWKKIFERPKEDFVQIKERVEDILNQIAECGDKAVLSLTNLIDKNHITLENLCVSTDEINKASEKLSTDFKSAIDVAYSNIEKFHMAQLRGDIYVETMQGVKCWQQRKPITRVGLYIPGGSAPLFSTVLMSVIPARISGVKEIIMCTPANEHGEIAPEIIYTAHRCGVDTIYKLGGAVAVGAMAYGTQTICGVEKIFGPGNRYLTYAKQYVSREQVAIDMPAGPSEVMVAADESCDIRFVAADLLSQLEHGGDSQAIAIVPTKEMAKELQKEILTQSQKLSRSSILDKSLDNCIIIVEQFRDTVMDMINYYAPEHLIISMQDADNFAFRVSNAASIFIGNYSPESAGDYASGTNHTLPTSGWAKSYSGVNTDSFSKYITYQKLSHSGLKALAPTIILMAEHEGLTAHANAVTIRTTNS